MSFTEHVRAVIDLSAAVREYWDRELPKRHVQYPLVLPGESSGPPPAEQDELRTLLDSLSDRELIGLFALIDVNWHKIRPDEFVERVREAAERGELNRERAVSILAHKVPLDRYLRRGLADIQRIGINPNAIFESHELIA